MRTVLRAGISGEAANVDDRSCIALLQQRQRGLHGEESAVEIDGKHLPPLGPGDLLDRRLGAQRRIIDQHVKAAEGGLHGGDHIGNGGLIGDVGENDLCTHALRPRQGGGLFQSVAIRARDQRHIGTGIGQCQRDGPANVARGTGDQRGFALHVLHGRFLR